MKKLVLVIFGILVFAGYSGAEDAELLVVTAKTPGEEITGKTVERIFLRKKVLWKDSVKIVPVNLPSEHPLRNIFNGKVLKRSVPELVEFWNAEHFKGNDPPDVLESEEAVKKFIKEVPGSIGYISPGNLDGGLVVIYKVR